MLLDEKEDKSVSSDDSNKKDAVKSWINWLIIKHKCI